MVKILMSVSKAKPNFGSFLGVKSERKVRFGQMRYPRTHLIEIQSNYYTIIVLLGFKTPKNLQSCHWPFM